MLCPNGHEVQADASFCPSCGAAVVYGGSDETNVAASASEQAVEKPIAPAPPRERRTLVVVLIVAALVIAIGVAIGGGILVLATNVFSSDETNTLTATLTAPECGGGYAL